MLPRLQDSYGSSGCSPQGLVASMRPSCGVGLCRLISSMKIDAGVAALPGVLYDQVPDVAGVELAGRTCQSWD